MRFDELGLAEPILRAVVAEGYTIPTPIQVQSIPHVLAGRDLLGCAQTGTGKTAAFALPILQRLSRNEGAAREEGNDGNGSERAFAQSHGIGQQNARGHTHGMGHGPHHRGDKTPVEAKRSFVRPIRAVLAPTRELASQIGQSFRVYGQNTTLRGVIIYGGVNQNRQTNALKGGADIVVATPGRLLDLMNQGYVDLSAIEVLVLDEADHMLDMGFIHDIRRIVAKVPKVRQSLFFSATMPPEIRKLADTILTNPVSVQVAAVSATADNVEQSIYHVKKKNKPALLAHLLSDTNFTRSLVFTRTKSGANKVVAELDRVGIASEAIHGNKSQAARERAILNFKTSKTLVLVATDIAARGLDIDDISHVVNYDLPNVPETYVHRIGRTARAGASGVAVSFCDPEERGHLKAIERLTRKTIRVNGEHPEYPVVEETHDHRERSQRPARPQQGRPTRFAAPSRGRTSQRGESSHRGRPASRDRHSSREYLSIQSHSAPSSDRPAAPRRDRPAHGKPGADRGRAGHGQVAAEHGRHAEPANKPSHKPASKDGNRDTGHHGVKRDSTGRDGSTHHAPKREGTHRNVVHGRKAAPVHAKPERTTAEADQSSRKKRRRRRRGGPRV